MIHFHQLVIGQLSQVLSSHWSKSHRASSPDLASNSFIADRETQSFEENVYIMIAIEDFNHDIIGNVSFVSFFFRL